MPIAYIRLLLGAFGLLLAGYTGWHVRGLKCDADIAEVQTKLQAEKDAVQDDYNAASYTFEQARAGLDLSTKVDTTHIRTIYRDREVPVGCQPDPDALRVLDNAIGDANEASAAGEPRQPVPADPATP